MSMVEPTRPGRVITNGGAGGNRTPVHQALDDRATIPTSVLTQHHRWVDFPSPKWWATCRLCDMSADFPAASVLSRCHPSLLLPGCDGLAPCGIAAHGVSQLPNELGGESELLVGNSFFALFNESEQLGSHVRPTKLVSKPVSPVCRLYVISVDQRGSNNARVNRCVCADDQELFASRVVHRARQLHCACREPCVLLRAQVLP